MKLLIITENKCDLSEVLLRCPVQTKVVSFRQAIMINISEYDAFCVLGNEKTTVIDARLRSKLEAEADKGKKIFLEYINSFSDIYSAEPRETTRSRLIYVKPENGEGISGLETGDLLDDECGLTMPPWFSVSNSVPLLVYKEHIIAHTHLDQPADEILKNSRVGMFRIGENILMAMFRMQNFIKARFAPRKNWEKLVNYIAYFLTGTLPDSMPESVVRFGTEEDLNDPETWQKARKLSIENGINWLEKFAVDNGEGGVMEGLRHNIRPDGKQERLFGIRTDCSGESAGAFAMYSKLTGSRRHGVISDNIRSFISENMVIRKAPFEGMLRWTDTAWTVCYHDDAARTMIPYLMGMLFMDDDHYLDDIQYWIDFLLRTTCRDGLAEARVNRWDMNEQRLQQRQQQEHGLPSAHYNAYYLAALLLAYKKIGKAEYLETARKGIETLMALYPDTKREQSETEEMCRLVLPLAVLYDVTKEEKHREYLYRVANDLEKHRHPFGGYCEWDTGYKASCSRESSGECSLLTENGDPVTDSLYSMNWLPVGFAYAYYATKDEFFRDLWKNTVTYFMRTQMFSKDPLLNGAWCRAFDMDLKEVYGCPHDVGWAANCCETGWTITEILMGMMLPNIISGENL